MQKMHLYFFPKNLYQYWSGANKENINHTTRGCWYTHFIGNQLLTNKTARLLLITNSANSKFAR